MNSRILAFVILFVSANAFAGTSDEISKAVKFCDPRDASRMLAIDVASASNHEAAQAQQSQEVALSYLGAVQQTIAAHSVSNWTSPAELIAQDFPNEVPHPPIISYTLTFGAPAQAKIAVEVIHSASGARYLIIFGTDTTMSLMSTASCK